MFSRLECPICFEGYDGSSRRPKILDYCGHSFCTFCLKNWLARVDTAESCPLCRSTVNVAREIRTNHELLELYERRKTFPPCSCLHSRTHHCPTCHSHNYADWEERLEDGEPTFCVSCAWNHEVDSDHKTIAFDDVYGAFGDLESAEKEQKPMSSGKKAMCTMCTIGSAALLLVITASAAVYNLF